jgi:putative Holliday junction resolvase
MSIIPINDVLPSLGSILALDWGKSRIGLAISDGLQVSTNPLNPVSYQKGNQAALEALERIVRERDIKGIVIGLPVSLDGGLGLMSDEVVKFAKGLKRKIKLPVAFHDESFSTHEAMDRLGGKSYSLKKRKELKDSISALVILESYLSQKALDIPKK